MLRQMLKSKIHRAMITGLELNYEGSIACDPEWLRAADVLPGEKVLVANLNNRARFETYAIIGKDRQGSARIGKSVCAGPPPGWGKLATGSSLWRSA